MAYRKIRINKIEWQYTVGRSNVHVKGPNGESFNAPTQKLATLIHCGCEPGYSCYDVPGVKPSDIKKFIESKLK